MSDKKGVPDWQKGSEVSHSEADAVDLPKESAATSDRESDRQALLEQARTFLSHEDIRDSTTESKISFLEEKGLTNSEIHNLLGISRNEATAPEPAVDVVQPSQLEGATTTASSVAGNETSSPPIITYPEFLLHASKPPPIITPTRVLNALYAGSVVGATIYGVSKFVLQPMFDSLTEARHDLYSTTKARLRPLNKELEGIVSQVPAAAKDSNVGHERRIANDMDQLDDDDSSVASDPTEMFHRDIGVQTSPAGSPSITAADAKGQTATATVQKLADLKGQLNVLLQSSSTTLNAAEKAKSEIRDTEALLDQLRYGSGGTGYNALSGDDGWRSQILGSKVAGTTRRMDAVDEFKADIRAMKGTLLSARNFPRGGERLAR